MVLEKSGIGALLKSGPGLSGRKYFTAFLTALFIMTAAVAWGQSPPPAPGPSPSEQYKLHRSTFLSKKRAMEARYRDQSRTLQERTEKVRQDIAQKNEEIADLNSRISSFRRQMASLDGIQAGISSFLFPFASLGSFLQVTLFGLGLHYILLFIFIPLTAINLYIYLWRREKPFFKKYFIVLTLFLVILLGAFASPLLAAENENREKIAQTLEKVADVLSQSDYQRFITILEARVKKWITIPSLSSGDPLLQVFHRVAVDSPEYYITLAALYTHEGQNGKALDAIVRLTDKKDISPSELHDRIIINSIKFLIKQKQMKAAGTAVDNLGDNILNMEDLLKLATYLNSQEMQPSSKKLLDIAIKKARTVQELVQLSRYFFEGQDTDQAAEALSKAVRAAKKIDQILLITNEAIFQKNDAIIKKVMEEIPYVTNQISDYIQLVDVFLNNGRKENAARLLDNMISKVKSTTPNFTSKLLMLIDETLKRDLLEQTIKAVSKLSMYLHEYAYDFTINEDFTLKSAQGLPDKSDVTLPVFYGLLNEELGFIDKAEDVYIQATLNSLEKILKNYGYNLPESLNEYYLLGRVWLNADRERLLSRLDAVYTALENHLLRQLKKKNDRTLQERQQALKDLKKQYRNRIEEIKRLTKTLSQERKKLILKMVNTAALALFVLAILAGCLIKSGQYSRRLSSHKTYGFITKFIEAASWVRIMSVMAIPSGLIGVFCSQLMQIVQQTHEKLHSIAACAIQQGNEPAAQPKGLKETTEEVNLSDEK